MRVDVFGVAVVAVMLAGGYAAAQPPVWVGGPVPPGELYGYSPLVHSIEPFPSKTSPYAQSIFYRGIGGKRLPGPPLAINPRCARVVEVRTLPPALPAPVAVPAGGAGPVIRAAAVSGTQRFKYSSVVNH